MSITPDTPNARYKYTSTTHVDNILEDASVKVHAKRVPRVAGLGDVEGGEDLFASQHTLGLGHDLCELVHVHTQQVGHLE
jgi:hypothetical protein